MNTRDRFRNVMTFGEVDRTLLWESGYWGGTMMRWYDEGLPLKRGLPAGIQRGTGVYGADNADAWDHFGLDPNYRALPLNTDLCPGFEPRLIRDHGTWVEHLSADGIVRRDYKDKSALPHFVSGPVRSRRDWEALKEERLQPDLASRVPADWEDLQSEYAARDYVLALAFKGLWGFPRDLLGVENLLLAFYDDPGMLRDMIDHLVELYVQLFAPVLAEIEVDLAFYHEDLCYKNGPFVSLDAVQEFLAPGYRKLNDFFRSQGIQIIALETDGDCRPLIRPLMDTGVNALWPFEVTNGQSIVEVRQEHPDLAIFGGLDKKALISGSREEIDRELESKVPFMLERGGYIPLLDHNASPDISLESYAYYRRRLNEMVLGAAG